MKKIFKIACIGDSITAGGDDQAQKGGWPGRLRERFRHMAVEIENLGVPGYITRQVTDDLLPRARQLRPDFMIVAVGVNDARFHIAASSDPSHHIPVTPEAAYRASVDNLLDEALNVVDRARLMVVTPLPVDQSAQASPGRWPDALVRDYAAILKAAAERRGIAVADLQTTLPAAVHPRKIGEFLRDGLHPTAEGYDLMAEHIGNAAVATFGLR